MSDFSDNECEIETDFNKAASYVQKVHSDLSSTELLALYGLFKQSTSGECTTSKPGIFNTQARAKWYAWNVLGKMDKTTAMQSYTDKLNTLCPDWNQQSKSSANASWVCHSMPTAEDPDDSPPDDEKTVFDYLKEENLEKLKKSVKKDEINTKDADGLGLIHWAADRNASEILEYLLFSGADVNLEDSDRQTALHYASSCGHLDCLRILLKFGADKDLKDTNGQTCLDVAFDQNIRDLLQS